MAVYIRQGQQQLPGDAGWEVFFSSTSLPLTELDSKMSLGLASQAAFLGDTDLKKVGVSRIVRKTSEKQSRWVIENSVISWRKLMGGQLADGNTGLFLGLGTVDCDDDGEQIAFRGDYNQLASEGLSKIKPLSGLTLLNSTTASHIAELLQITGVNGVYSPHADAGGNAIAEAYFNLCEGQCELALVSGGSPKITPWYFLSSHSALSTFVKRPWFPAEAVSTSLLSSNPDLAEGCLLAVHRGFSASFQMNHSALDLISLHLSPPLTGQSSCSLQQIIHVGHPEIALKMAEQSRRFYPEAHHLLLDQHIGTSGPAGTVVGLNLALEIIKRQVLISNERGPLKTIDCDVGDCRHVLLACYGLQGQQVFALVGDVDAAEEIEGDIKGAKDD